MRTHSWKLSQLAYARRQCARRDTCARILDALPSSCAHARKKQARSIWKLSQLAYARRQCARSDTRTCAHILDALPFLRTCAQKTSAQHLETVPTSICAPTVRAQRHAHMRAHTGRAAIPAHMRAKNMRAAKAHDPSP